MRKKLHLYEAGSTDNDLIALLVHELFTEVLPEDEMPSDAVILQATDALVAQSGFSTLLAVDDHHKPLGIMTIADAINLRTGRSYAIVLEMFVAPGERSRGVGEAMLHHLKAMAPVRGWVEIQTAIPAHIKSGTRAKGFFERCGFTLFGQAMSLPLSDEAPDAE